MNEQKYSFTVLVVANEPGTIISSAWAIICDTPNAFFIVKNYDGYTFVVTPTFIFENTYGSIKLSI
jgi:uncharacterized protein (UPF0218 family)